MNLLILALDPVPPVTLPDADILVVAPALNSRLRRWLSDEDAARGRADERAVAFVARLARRGVHADGRIGMPIRCWRSRMRCTRSRPTRS